MDDMEREALRRAEKMRGAFTSAQKLHKENASQSEVSVNPEKIEEKPKLNYNNEPKIQKQNEDINTKKFTEKEGGDILEFLLKDKEATIIILMIFFLYDDGCDPMLLMALIYLLI